MQISQNTFGVCCIFFPHSSICVQYTVWFFHTVCYYFCTYSLGQILQYSYYYTSVVIIMPRCLKYLLYCLLVLSICYTIIDQPHWSLEHCPLHGLTHTLFEPIYSHSVYIQYYFDSLTLKLSQTQTRRLYFPLFSLYRKLHPGNN